VAKIPSVGAVKDYVKNFTAKLRAFRKWDKDFQYEPDDPTYYRGKFYYANPDNPPDKGQDPESFIDRWNLMTGGGEGGAVQTIRRRIKVARPGVKVLNIKNDLNLSESLQYRITPVLASNYQYFRHIFVERRGDDLWIYLYSDTEPYTYPRIGYLYGSTVGTNVKIGSKLVGTFYLGRVRPVEEIPPPLETELVVGAELIVGQFIVGYVPEPEKNIVMVGDLIVGLFIVGQKMQEEEDVEEETPDEELPGIFIDLFIQREV